MDNNHIRLSRVIDVLSNAHGQYVKHYLGNQLVYTGYPQLAEDALHVAESLTRAGIGAGDFVGILADNCYNWIVLDLALVHLQAICVGIPSEVFADTNFDELAEKYDLCLLVTDRCTSQPARPWLCELKDIASIGFCKREVSTAKLSDKHDLFSLGFSSGTSGQIKCLKFSRKGTDALLVAFGRDFEFVNSDAIFAFLPLSTIQQRWMLYTSIYYGFSLCLCTPARLFSGLREMHPTIVCSAPLLFETVEAQYLLLNVNLRLLIKGLTAVVNLLPKVLRKAILRCIYSRIYDFFGGNIRFFLVGAAPSRLGTLNFYRSIGLPLYEAWGLTETGFLSWNVPGRERLGSVGFSVFENSLEIAEDGEILVRHDNLPCIGYYDVATEEQQRVFPQPGVIATGDLGRFDRDGFLYIIGRKKDMIVTRGGFKIQPAELEKYINQNQYVSNAVVVGGDEHNNLTVVISIRGSNKHAKQSIELTVSDLNKTKPAPSRIHKVVFTDEQFTRENQLLNRNLKVDRKRVYQRFKHQMAV